jgi:hypothetical protein
LSKKTGSAERFAAAFLMDSFQAPMAGNQP